MSRMAFYPPGPKYVPEDLTLPTEEYRTQAFLVLVSLLLFFGTYLALLFGSLVVIVLSIVLTPCVGTIFIGGPALLFFLFLVKGFFRKEMPTPTFRVEITERDHPKLFRFIDELCEETQAPRPYRVFLSPEVNAAVFYNDSVLSFLIPPPKNLLIGMGLVNVLTLHEFKAVLAHEFGHFSQQTMALDRYVYTASRIMADMVYQRDWFDNFVFGLRDNPNGGAPVALGWMIYVPLWLFRKGLEGCLYGINYLGAGLSRQMEFNADLVAVSVAGSDAIVQALARIQFASESLDQAIGDLRVAGDHGLLTADLFYHQNHAMTYLRRIRKNPQLGEVPPLPEDPEYSPDVFTEDEDPTPDMWASHPPCFDREQNAKRIYIRCELDERSPWILFDDPPALRERISRRFYKVVVGLRRDEDLDDPKTVQKFIDEEHAETTYHPRYHGAYDNRSIRTGSIDDLETKVIKEPWKPEVLLRVSKRLYSDDLKERMKELNTLREEYGKVIAVETGAEKCEDGTFRFRGKRYDEEEARRLSRKIEKEMDEELDWLAEFDERVFRTHFQMARELGSVYSEELLYRYRFHMLVQAIDLEMNKHKPELERAMAILSESHTTMHYEDFEEIRSIFRKAHDSLTWCINKADKWKMPVMKNIPKDTIFGHFLLDRKMVKALGPGAKRLTAKWINRFLGQISEVLDRIHRIHFKSLGGILSLQEKILERWTKELADIPTVAESEEEEPSPPARPKRNRHL